MNLNPLSARTFVPPEGPTTAKFVFIGEQPGRQEIATARRRPFIGPAGQELRNILTKMSIHPDNCYFTNVIKDLDRPLVHYFVKDGKYDPEWTEKGKVYLDTLREELSSLDAEVLIPLGNIGLCALTSRYGIESWAGSILNSTLIKGKKVVATLHPSTVIRGVFTNRRLIMFDILRAKDIIFGTYVPTEREILIAPSYLEVEKFLQYCFQTGKSGSHVAYDIEIMGSGTEKQVSCISFSINMRSMSIPFCRGTEPIFSSTEEYNIWCQINMILEDEEIKKVGQNLAFDSHFLLRRYGIKTRNMEDTMIAQNVISPDYPKGLDFITRIWTDHPYYKKDGKDFFAGASSDLENFWKYNATDSIICDEVWPKQEHTIKEMGNRDVYLEQRKLIPPCTYMMERGIKVDIERLVSAGDKFQEDEEKYRGQLEELVTARCQKANDDMSWYTRKMASSSKQLKIYFHEICHAPTYKTLQKKIGFDDIVLKRLIRKGFQEAHLIQEIRRVRKLRSTYTNLDKIDDDSRMRCSYNPAGTRFSRLSSSASLFGKGMNMQNWPHELLSYLVPDEGYIYYSPDLSQAENRIVAYVAGCQPMIDAFETGRDVHSRTAALILGINEDEVSREKGSSPWRSMQGKSQRDEGKTANHGLNYDLGYRSFALRNEMQETDAKRIVNLYHYVYPEVRQVFHNYIKESLRKSRTVTNLMGRKTVFHGRLDDMTFKEAYSCIPQGTVGDIMNKVINRIYYNQKLFGPVELLNQLHDSLGFQIPISVGWQYHAMALKEIKKYFEIELTTHAGRTFTIPIDYSISLTLNKEDGEEIKAKDFPNDLTVLAKRLEGIYNGLKKRV